MTDVSATAPTDLEPSQIKMTWWLRQKLSEVAMFNANYLHLDGEGEHLDGDAHLEGSKP